MEQIYTTYKESYGRKTSFSGFLGFVKEKPLLIDDPIFSGEAVQECTLHSENKLNKH